MTSTAQSITVRLAQPHEGALVGELVKAFGGPDFPWLDWSDVYPYWLIGEVDGQPRGVVMVTGGKPFGHIEVLCVDPTLAHKQKALLVRDLGYAGIASCQAMGATAVLAGAGWQDEGWLKVMQRRGWLEREWGSFLIKRI